jgi:hypothetical protein
MVIGARMEFNKNGGSYSSCNDIYVGCIIILMP